jgi:hypothetical protein
LQESYEDTREVASERDRSVRALKQKHLVEPDLSLKPGFFQQVGKNWSWSWQVALALIMYFITPNIAKYAKIEYPEPATLAIFAAVLTFFAVPFIRGVLKK